MALDTRCTTQHPNTLEPCPPHRPMCNAQCPMPSMPSMPNAGSTLDRSRAMTPKILHDSKHAQHTASGGGRCNLHEAKVVLLLREDPQLFVRFAVVLGYGGQIVELAVKVMLNIVTIAKGRRSDKLSAAAGGGGWGLTVPRQYTGCIGGGCEGREGQKGTTTRLTQNDRLLIMMTQGTPHCATDALLHRRRLPFSMDAPSVSHFWAGPVRKLVPWQH